VSLFKATGRPVGRFWKLVEDEVIKWRSKSGKSMTDGKVLDMW
jgi:hypothetical protein